MITWHNGTPFAGVDTTNDPGQTLYWYNGTPFGIVFEATAASNIKKFNTILFGTNSKKIMGVTIANIKKLTGITV